LRDCRQLGYQGRLGIYELLLVSEALRPLIMNRAPATTIAQTAIEHGMRTLRQDGWKKVQAGLTTIEEVLRVTQIEDTSMGWEDWTSDGPPTQRQQYEGRGQNHYPSFLPSSFFLLPFLTCLAGITATYSRPTPPAGASGSSTRPGMASGSTASTPSLLASPSAKRRCQILGFALAQETQCRPAASDEVFLRVLQLPTADETEARQIVELQLERLSPLPITQIVWSLHLLPETGESTTRTVIVLIADRSVVEKHLGRFRIGGLPGGSPRIARAGSGPGHGSERRRGLDLSRRGRRAPR